LKSYGEFPETVKINETVTFGEEGIDDDIEFDEVDSSEEENDIGADGIDNI
jgi:translation initiation factor 1A